MEQGTIKDQAINSVILDEQKRQEAHIELIASENYVSEDVMRVQGSVLTNKYAEGYPRKRYYGGCVYVDQAEELAIERACKLFGVNYANVQPHSGTNANAAVYQALMEPGDTLLGMALDHGGHLTHGATVSSSGRYYKSVSYGVCSDGSMDYEQVHRLALEHKPKVIVAGFSAFSRIVDWARFRSICDEVGAYLMADIAHVAGLVAAGVYPSPFPHAHVVTTTTHKTLRGPRGGMILANADEALAKKLNFAVFPASQGGPLMHVIAAKAVAFAEALEPSFVDYQKQVVSNAKVMAEVIQERGYRVVSGGTDNHMFLVDLIGHEQTGKELELLLEKVHITLNKNMVPGDPRSPFKTSGLRIGTPAMTTRGMKEEEARLLANIICDVLDKPGSDAVLAAACEQASNLAKRFPVYGDQQ